MKANEIGKPCGPQVETQVMDLKKHLFNLRLQMATSQLDNTARVSQVKKDIARIQTEMRARELSA